MLRWLASAFVVLLFVLNLTLPSTPLGRRGSEAIARADVEGAVGSIGSPLPELALEGLDGRPISLADFRGHPLLVTFERSVDW
jgi:cytochrome oxidase Cu insertion factor (SCO1/SenC/PrrC family)